MLAAGSCWQLVDEYTSALAWMAIAYLAHQGNLGPRAPHEQAGRFQRCGQGQLRDDELECRLTSWARGGSNTTAWIGL